MSNNQMKESEKKTNNKEGNNLRRYMKSAAKMLIKARDFYIKSMTGFSDKVVLGNFVAGCPSSGHVNTTSLTRSYSVNSSRSRNGDEDFRELIRAASVRTNLRQPPRNGNNKMFKKSFSVGIGRIDEEKPCDFEDDMEMIKKDHHHHVYRRSKSLAVVS